MSLYCIEISNVLGYYSIDIASIYSNNIALVINHYYLASKEMIRRRIVNIVVSFIPPSNMISMVPTRAKIAMETTVIVTLMASGHKRYKVTCSSQFGFLDANIIY